MALTFQGISKSDIETGIIGKIEIAIQDGSPSYVDAGDFTHPQISIEPLSMKSDPSGSDLVYALRFSFSFSIVQTLKTAELAAMAGVADTGVYETDVQIKYTYLSGRVVTLGSITAYPLRMLMTYTNGSESEAQRIDCTGTTIEPISSIAAKVA